MEEGSLCRRPKLANTGKNRSEQRADKCQWCKHISTNEECYFLAIVLCIRLHISWRDGPESSRHVYGTSHTVPWDQEFDPGIKSGLVLPKVTRLHLDLG